MQIIAIFMVRRIVPLDDGEQAQLLLYPDYSDSQNKSWARYAATGGIQLNVHTALASQLKQGQRVVITLTPEE